MNYQKSGSENFTRWLVGSNSAKEPKRCEGCERCERQEDTKGYEECERAVFVFPPLLSKPPDTKGTKGMKGVKGHKN